ncbi:hypothetical protein QWJ26_32490 [Streptomyces sp. CSDS2]|uniref:hypothetical protein n=1 Tax=Streptomyces sp. CSDS2 TaxID=3055051 RepID=UPI0025AF74B5|nr:hypothetical protein [Streptomyces sp. CSDS2]MDN3264448.1 hypothetical protein [Streptomyces sp. CSDS2]
MGIQGVVMAGSAHATLGTASRARSAPTRTTWPLAAVAAAFTLAQLLLVPPGMGLGWDETVYVSQVGHHAPAAFFSAPRARGVSLLVAPVAAWSSSTALLRLYLALLSGLALFWALRAWRGLFPVRVLALAGGLFGSLWVTLFYGPQAMPNLWVALGALAAVGCFLRARTGRTALWGLAGGAALMAWMRPVDAVWAVLPLVAAGLARRRWRALLALSAGLAAGAAEWVAEAYTSYGGLARRLSDGSAIQGGLGWHLAVVDQLRALGGRTLCRPCTGALPHPLLTLWWFALPSLAALAVTVALRARRPAATLLPLGCAATAAFPYLFLIGYAAPRFLLPAYALLAVPLADALARLLSARRAPVRALVCAGLAAHLAAQLAVAVRTTDNTVRAREAWARTVAVLHGHGVRPPCLLTGHEAIPVAYAAGCASAATTGPNANATPDAITRTARRMPVAALVPAGAAPPGYARGWTSTAVGTVRLYYVVPGTGS